MIAVDTSSFIAYFAGEAGRDIDLINEYLDNQKIVLPCVVLAELMSDFNIKSSVQLAVSELPLLTISSGYWARAGQLRALLLAKGYKARLADTLIAQQCVDADVPLITRDGDYRRIAQQQPRLELL